MKHALIDSDVLIWLLRGNARAIAALNTLDDWSISAVTYMEVVQGCRNKAELRAMQKALRGAGSSGADILPIVPRMSDTACELVEKHALSHRLYMADALIAATALHHKLPLLTGNAKHFDVVAGLHIVVFHPT
jgi:predicted nucleic acid-binding protein